MSHPRRGKADFYSPGEYNVACFQCGRKFKSGVMRKHWQGYLVCPEHWEPRHPQDFVRAVPDYMGVDNAQPPGDVFVYFCTLTGMSAVADYAVADCMIAEQPPYPE